ncbi:MAG: hypothetical protein IPH45_19015 [Bacteroidales bacterium]|nr:hypothetical protein [Bacteroidales bacterium]
MNSGIPALVPGLPVLYWKINNASTWNQSIGSLTGVNTYSFTFGNGVALHDVVYYYICAQDNFLYPNVAVSTASGADSLSSNPPACHILPSPTYAYRIVGTLPAGNYLIGGTGNTPSAGCTYVDITQAFGDVNDVVDRIEVTNGGSGYSLYATTVTLSGGGGSGAVAQAIIDTAGSITAIEITQNGSGYYSAPAVSIEDVSGIGATATAYISEGKVIAGPVNFVIDTSYLWGEENAFPLHLEAMVGSSATNTLTLKPGPLSSPTLYANYGYGVLKLNGADYFTLDGSNNGSSTKDLTVYYLAGYYNAAVVWIASASENDGATHNTIKNCIIQGSGASTLTYAGIFSGGTASVEHTYYALTPNSYNTIENNTIYYARNGIAALGKSASELDEGLIISNNQVGTDIAGEGVTYQGIFVENQHAGFINRNHIQNIFYNDFYHEITGINIINSKTMSVSANRIHNLRQARNGVPWYVDGIIQNTPAFNTAMNPSGNIYSNNVIYDLTSNGTCNLYNVVGIHNVSGWGDKYYYNSVYLAGQLNAIGNPGGGMSACFANGKGPSSGNTSNIEVKNNIFYMNGHNPSGVIDYYAHYAALNSYTGSTLDYNMLFDSVTGTATGHVGYFNNLNQNEISDWRSATLQDNSSLSVDPLFSSVTNLAPQPGSPLLGSGTPIPEVTTDFPGNFRDPMHPSIGAYEFQFVSTPKNLI